MTKRSNKKKTDSAVDTTSSLRQSTINFRNTIRSSLSQYLSRRPHRSFRYTRRRDYVRSLSLPGYWSFTFSVIRVLLSNKKLFLGLLLFYVTLGAVFVGLSSQGTYAQLSSLLDDTSGGVLEGGWGSFGQAGLLLLSGISGSFSPQLTDAQQIYSALILLLTWLTAVWLLRVILAGKKPRLRDGLYNAGGPIVATGIVFLLVLVQLLPAAIGVIIFSSAMTTNLFETGYIAMMISIVVGLLIVASLYWVVSGLLAMIVVTLPGMYPWRAIRTAGDMAIGRRIRILLRILWMLLIGFISWIVVLLPVIVLTRLLEKVLPFIQSVPIVPVVMACMSSLVVVWSATYMYVLYRKIVEDDAKPA